MDKQTKEAIKEALEAYLKKHGMSQNDFAQSSGVNVSYISSIRSEKESNISEKWYKIIAEKVGYTIEKNYWETKSTPQTLRILATLEDARKFGYTNVIIGETGCGKTYTCDLFARKYPSDVFVIKIGSNDNITDVMQKIIDSMKIPSENRHRKLKTSSGWKSNSLRIRRIIKHLQHLKNQGYNPMIILDESEYMKAPTLCAIKEIYDSIFGGIAALILMGTDQLIKNIENLKNNNRPGIPQFYSRIKFGIRYLSDIDSSFSLFIKEVEDKDVRNYIKANCENYREVRDILVPARREADRLNVSLDLDIVYKVLGIGD